MVQEVKRFSPPHLSPPTHPAFCFVIKYWFFLVCKVRVQYIFFLNIWWWSCLLDLRGNRRQMKTDDTDDENETEDDGQTSESGSGSPPDQKLQHKMCVFRFKLMQFINCIHNHFMTRVSGTLSCNMNYCKVHFLK